MTTNILRAASRKAAFVDVSECEPTEKDKKIAPREIRNVVEYLSSSYRILPPFIPLQYSWRLSGPDTDRYRRRDIIANQQKRGQSRAQIKQNAGLQPLPSQILHKRTSQVSAFPSERPKCECVVIPKYPDRTPCPMPMPMPLSNAFVARW